MHSKTKVESIYTQYVTKMLPEFKLSQPALSSKQLCNDLRLSMATSRKAPQLAVKRKILTHPYVASLAAQAGCK